MAWFVSTRVMTLSLSPSPESVLLGWFSWEQKNYEPSVTLDQQVELLSLIGDVALKDGKPVVHAHAADR